MNFDDLKTNSEQLLRSLKDKMETAKEKNFSDDRFWKLTRDKSNRGFATIRFLPPGKNDNIMVVKYFEHGFRGPNGRWLIEKCPTSIGEQCPICDFNTKKWNSGIEEEQTWVRENSKRKKFYVSNIYIIDDALVKENNGKVFLYQYGEKIYNKIEDLTHPANPNKKVRDPFNFWAGANFNLECQKVSGYINYDKSYFDGDSPLLDGDETKLRAIWDSCHTLNDYIDPKNYKSYSELQAQLDRVMGDSAPEPYGNNQVEQPQIKFTEDTNQPYKEWSSDSLEDDDIDLDSLASKLLVD